MDKLFILYFCGFMKLSMAIAENDEMTANVTQAFVICMEKEPLTDEEMTALQASDMRDDGRSACFMACVYRQFDLMDEDGMFLTANAENFVAQLLLENKAEMNKSINVVKVCKSVNDQDVKDGREGCERASLLFKCISENSAKVGIEM